MSVEITDILKLSTETRFHVDSLFTLTFYNNPEKYVFFPYYECDILQEGLVISLLCNM
jgi:hypothetical protein